MVSEGDVWAWAVPTQRRVRVMKRVAIEAFELTHALR
jgi:hypothetical protein